MAATGITFQDSQTFPKKNKLFLTKEMQNARSNSGFFFHLFIKRDKFIEITVNSHVCSSLQ